MNSAEQRVDSVPLVMLLIVPFVVARTLNVVSADSRTLVYVMGVLMALALIVWGLRPFFNHGMARKAMTVVAVVLMCVWSLSMGLLLADPTNQSQDLVTDLLLAIGVFVVVLAGLAIRKVLDRPGKR